MSERRPGGGLGPMLLIALLVASLAAGIFVYRARTANLALEVPRIDRLLGEGPRAKLPVELEFFVRFDEPDATVEIVGSGAVTARTLATDVALDKDERIECTWDGLDDQGDPVEPGNYRLRVALPEQDRDMVFPLRIAVRRTPPVSDTEPGASCVRLPGGESFE